MVSTPVHSRQLRAAIVGLGWWGREMVGAVSRSPGARLNFTHAVVRNAAAASEFADAHQLALHASLVEALDNPEVDAIVLATPHSQHVDQIVACARAGKPVFTEKPIALTLEQAKIATDACREANIVLGIGTDRRFLPAMRRLAQLVAGGAIGQIVHIEGQYSNDNMSRGVSGDWRLAADEAPGAGMTGPGLHALDSMIGIAGPVAAIAGQLYRPHGEAIPVDAVSLLIRFAQGTTGTLGCVRGVENYFRLAVFGESGRIEMRGFGQLEIAINGSSIAIEEFAPELAIADTLDLFAAAVLSGGTFPVTPTAILETCAAFEAAIAVLNSGQMTAVDVSPIGARR